MLFSYNYIYKKKRSAVSPPKANKQQMLYEIQQTKTLPCVMVVMLIDETGWSKMIIFCEITIIS